MASKTAASTAGVSFRVVFKRAIGTDWTNRLTQKLSQGTFGTKGTLVHVHEAVVGALARSAWAAAVLAHPHPQFGGSMRSIVIGALFSALPSAGVAALRFNFRGVEGSEGTFDEGRGERQDVVAAVDVLHPITEGLPLVLAGWSFGGVLAYEIAQQLVASGERVDFLGLLDANPVRDPITGLKTTEAPYFDMLTKVLTYHVVAGRWSASQLKKEIKAGHGQATLKTVSGGRAGRTYTARLQPDSEKNSRPQPAARRKKPGVVPFCP